jgi:exopolysaccharide production protein ExoZ
VDPVSKLAPAHPDSARQKTDDAMMTGSRVTETDSPRVDEGWADHCHWLTSVGRRLSDIYELAAGRNRIAAMEGLRGFAVLLVFFVHYDGLFVTYAPSTSTTAAVSGFASLIGNSGVDLFFVLSGFLIYGMAIRKPIKYVSFICRRVQRIYPVFLFVLSLYLLFSALVPEKSKVPTDVAEATFYVLQNIALLPGLFAITPIITVAWSLSYELFFYLTLPLLVHVTRMHRWTRPLRILFFSVCGLIFLSFSWFLPHPHLRLMMFVAGILLYEVLQSAGVPQGLSGAGEVLSTLLLAASFITIYVSREHVDLRSSLDSAYARQLLWVLLFGVSFFCLTMYSFGRNGFMGTMFSWAPLRWLGNMSYSYYLIHGLTLNGVVLVAHGAVAADGHAPALFWILMPPSFLATVVASTLLFVGLEKPFSLRVGSATRDTNESPSLAT